MAIEWEGERIKSIREDFCSFDNEDRKLELLMKRLPDEYELNYLVYSCAKNYFEMERLWNERLSDLVLYKSLGSFDNYVERNYLEN